MKINRSSSTPDPQENPELTSGQPRVGQAAPSNRIASRASRYGTNAGASSNFGESRAESFNITGKALTLVFLAIIVASIFYGFQYFKQRETVNASISYVSHEVIDDNTLRIWADITRNRPDEAAYCIVQAYDYDKTEVGRREIALAPASQSAIRVAVDIPTNARAVAGGVYGCSSQIPSYLDVDSADDPGYIVENK